MNPHLQLKLLATLIALVPGSTTIAALQLAHCSSGTMLFAAALTLMGVVIMFGVQTSRIGVTTTLLPLRHAYILAGYGFEVTKDAKGAECFRVPARWKVCKAPEGAKIDGIPVMVTIVGEACDPVLHLLGTTAANSTIVVDKRA